MVNDTLPAKLLFLFTLFLFTLGQTGCATPYIYQANTGVREAELHADYAQMQDGYRLPLEWWGDPASSKTIILALHGMNDYRNAWKTTGEYLSKRGIAVIAYDQRGFGESAGAGYWHGRDKLVDDSLSMTRLLRQKYSDRNLYVMGESMGGAVILAALEREQLPADGIILLAPAVWSRDTMPWYQRLVLWLTVKTIPGKKLTGENLDIHPSDNIEMLRALGRDPLIIKETRVDVLYGITNLMDAATKAANRFTENALILYGRHDDIIPRRPTCDWLKSLPDDTKNDVSVILYKNGYHMLNRDLQAENVYIDIVNWISAQNTGSDMPARTAALLLKDAIRSNNPLGKFCRQ
jgi:acylglycerol lipase